MTCKALFFLNSLAIEKKYNEADYLLSLFPIRVSRVFLILPKILLYYPDSTSKILVVSKNSENFDMNKFL